MSVVALQNAPTIADVLHLQRGYTYLPDATPTLFSAAVAVGAQLTGTPLWGLHVGAPSAGKSESVGIVADVADIRSSEITAAGLLSFTKGSKPKPTGLLTRIGDRGLLTISDLSPIIAGSDKGQADKLFGILREVYDGRVGRDLGQSGHLSWEGRLTILAAVTTEIDRYASHADALGPRWLYCRHPPLDAEARRQAMAMAAGDRDERARLRNEAKAAAAIVIRNAAIRLADPLTTTIQEQAIVDVAEVVALGRSSVPRTGYGKREIIGEAVREEPMRLVEQLGALWAALVALGVDYGTALRTIHTIGLDSMPLTRRKVLGQLATGEQLTAAEIARRVGTDRKVVRFALEDLAVLGACTYDGAHRDDEEDGSRVARPWRITGDDAQSVTRAFARDTKARGTKIRINPPTPQQGEGNARASLTFVPPSGAVHADPEAA